MKQTFFPSSLALLMILLLFQPIPTHAQLPDLTKIGVSNGDSFTYVVDNYTRSGSEGQALAYNGSAFFNVKTGDEYSITVTNNTPYHVGDGLYMIDYLVSNATLSMNSSSIINLFAGPTFMLTDWTGLENNFTGVFSTEFPPDELISYNVSNGVDEFVIIWVESPTDGGDGIVNSYEHRYNKTNGVKLYGNSDNFIFGQRTTFINRLKGYLLPSERPVETNSTSSSTSSSSSTSTSITVNSDTSSSTASSSSSDGSSFVPGFDIFISSSTLIAIFTLMKYKKS